MEATACSDAKAYAAIQSLAAHALFPPPLADRRAARVGGHQHFGWQLLELVGATLGREVAETRRRVGPVPEFISFARLLSRQVWWHDGDMHKVPANGFSLAIEYHREVDGRWLADIPALPGVTAYGRTKKQATAAVQALALRLIADRLEHGEAVPGPMNVSFSAA